LALMISAAIRSAISWNNFRAGRMGRRAESLSARLGNVIVAKLVV
jgi:hypothetical protein